MTWGFMLGPGTLAAIQLTTVTTYDIENFTRQADMNPGRDWQRPEDEAERVKNYAELVDSIDSHRGAYGGIEFKWPLRLLTPLMEKYIRDTYFSSTAFSADVTARTYNRNSGQFEIYNIVARRPGYDDLELTARGYDRYILTFTNGVTASSDEPDMAIDVTHPTGTGSQSATSTFTFEVDNVGALATFNDIVVVVTLGFPDLTFSAITAATYTIEYSDDGGLSYSGSPPGSETHIRVTRSASLAASASADFTIDLTHTNTGTHTVSATVSNVGDTNSANDTDSQQIVVT